MKARPIDEHAYRTFMRSLAGCSATKAVSTLLKSAAGLAQEFLRDVDEESFVRAARDAFRLTTQARADVGQGATKH